MKNVLITITSLLILQFAYGQTTDTTTTEEISFSVYYGDDTAYISYKGEDFLHGVVTNTDWKIETPNNWITLTPSSGTGNRDEIVMHVEESPSPDERIGTVLFYAQEEVRKTLIVKQEGIPDSVLNDTLYLSIPNMNDTSYHTYQAEELAYELLSNTSWEIKSPDAWISTTPESGTGNNNILLAVEENRSSIERSGKVLFYANNKLEKELRVQQERMPDSLFNDSTTFTITGNIRYELALEDTSTQASTFHFFDFDGDGDKDVICGGRTSDFTRDSHVFLNDGDGNFQKTGKNFEGQVILAEDFDNDGDIDLLTNNSSDLYIFYFNEGNGNYVETIDSSFFDYTFISVACTDIDADSDKDILLCGTELRGDHPRNIERYYITYLYKNDGLGSFERDTTFDVSNCGKVQFADIDGDGDQDFIIGHKTFKTETVQNVFRYWDSYYLRIFTNDGLGNFSKAHNALPEDLESDIIDLDYWIERNEFIFTDIDTDGDIDLFVSDSLLINDGTGNFSYSTNLSFPNGAKYVADIDMDNDDDILIRTDTSSLVYINMLQGNYFVDTSILVPILGKTDFVDFEDDGDMDFVVTGVYTPEINEQYGYTAHFYKNLATCPGIILAEPQLPALNAWYSTGIPSAPTAVDSCGNILIGLSDIAFPISDTTIKSVNWTYHSNKGSFKTQSQNINWVTINNNISTEGNTLIAEDTTYTYQWMNCDQNFEPIEGATEYRFTPEQNGNYALEISYMGFTDTSNCISINTLDIQLTENRIICYPNPSKGLVSIYLGNNQACKIEVFDLTGKRIHSKRNNSSSTYEFKLPSGYYEAVVTFSDNTERLSIVVE